VFGPEDSKTAEAARQARKCDEERKAPFKGSTQDLKSGAGGAGFRFTAQGQAVTCSPRHVKVPEHLELPFQACALSIYQRTCCGLGTGNLRLTPPC